MTKVLTCLLRAIACLPWSILYALSDAICWVMCHIVHYRRKVIRQNLRNSFPEKTEQEIRDLEKKFYHHLSDLIVESLKLLHISDEDIRQRVSFENIGMVEKLAEDGKPLILFMGHIGNWEWCQSLAMFCQRPQHLITLYKPLKSETANNVFKCIRSRFEVEKIPSSQALKALLRYNKQGRQFMAAFIADQRTTCMKNAMMFMGQKSTYYTGGEDLGRHLHAHMLYLYVEKTSRGHYKMTIKDLDETADLTKPYPYTHAFMQLLEENIRRQPEIWIWSHNRWKNNHKIEVPAE